MHAPLEGKPAAASAAAAPAARAFERTDLGPDPVARQVQARLGTAPRVAQLKAQAEILNRARAALGPPRESGPSVLQGYFLAPHPSELRLVYAYLTAVAPQMLGEFQNVFESAEPIYLYDWLDDRLGLTMHAIYDWDDARVDPMAEEPPDVVAQDLGGGGPQPALGGQQDYFMQPDAQQMGGNPPEVPQIDAQLPDAEQHGQQVEANQGQWMVGTVAYTQEGHAVVQTAERSYWLHAEAPFELGTEIHFFWSAERPDEAFWPQPVATIGAEEQQEQAPQRTVPPSAIDQAQARVWLTRMRLSRNQRLQLIQGDVLADPESAREHLENWNAAGEGEPIALEDVGWNMAGYEAAAPGRAEVLEAPPTHMTVTLGHEQVEAEIINVSGGYHIILQHPRRPDMIIRQRRRDAETTIRQGMANWGRLRGRLRATVGEAIRVPAVEDQADAYIVEKVQGTVDALEMWNHVHRLDRHSPEARILWARLEAIRTLIQRNLEAMQQGQEEPFPDFRPANVGVKEGAPELIYIDFDQSGEVKEEADLMDQIHQWAGQRYALDPGGARAVDPEFLAWLMPRH
jgi:hypothetical protein